MITYEQALKIAQSYMDGIDRCVEYPEVWMFCNSAHDEDIGGWYSPKLIRKKDGKRIPVSEFYMGRDYNTYSIREFKVEQIGEE